jgi:hypothetical protein
MYRTEPGYFTSYDCIIEQYVVIAGVEGSFSVIKRAKEY